MIYLAVDTCVWLELLKTDFNQVDNHFEELMYWIENGMITCVTTQNLIDEWSRHKVSKKQTVVSAFTQLDKQVSNIMSAAHPMDSPYKPDKVEVALQLRIDRIDAMFSTIAEVAKETEDIFLTAAKRNLACLAPNHSGDSYRDTVNYLTLKKYVKGKGYSKCIFTTINHNDFSDPGANRYKLHQQLVKEFSDGNLEYSYFDNTPEKFSGILFNVQLRRSLPSFADHLKAERQKEEREKLDQKKVKDEKIVGIDPEFVANTEYIDHILQKSKRTAFDEDLLERLFEKSPSYKSYFLRKLTENGMV
ncbi:MAG: hypothetical protein EOO20_01630 [Chryseobacterium sp.]|nr:MAG: hypothetical protein EOO20_01630 [Chryseobacterium sp.]